MLTTTLRQVRVCLILAAVLLVGFGTREGLSLSQRPAPPKLSDLYLCDGAFESPHLAQKLPYRVYGPLEASAEPMRVVVYLRNLNVPRNSSASDESILAGLVDKGFLVAAVDYGHDKRACGAGMYKDVNHLFRIFGGEHHPVPIPPQMTAYTGFDPERNRPVDEVRGERIVDGQRRKVTFTISRKPWVYVIPEGYTIEWNLPVDTLVGSNGAKLALHMDVIHPVDPVRPVPTLLEVSTGLADVREKPDARRGRLNRNTCYPYTCMLYGYAAAILDNVPNAITALPLYGGPVTVPDGPHFPEKRSVRLIRAHGREWGLTERVGILGMSKSVIRACVGGMVNEKDLPTPHVSEADLGPHADRADRFDLVLIGSLTKVSVLDKFYPFLSAGDPPIVITPSLRSDQSKPNGRVSDAELPEKYEHALQLKKHVDERGIQRLYICNRGVGHDFNYVDLDEIMLFVDRHLKPSDDRPETCTNSLGMKFVGIRSGSFTMGQRSRGDFDERPVHKVTIPQSVRMSATEVTNAQYEQFDPSHRKLRGRLGFSKGDDEAVVFVSWHDAVRFCKWLSEKEGKPYRLPTEAEWEYACRAGTTTAYHTGDSLPKAYHKNQENRAVPKPISLGVGATPPNPWGLFDMHGNVEEWCGDWYGPYEEGDRTAPVGRTDGDFKVARGGSHNTDVRFLRSANRSAALPEDKHWLIGFRFVVGDAPGTKTAPSPRQSLWSRNVTQESHDWSGGPDPAKAYFEGPITYVNIPPDSNGPMFSKHNHDPGLAYCPNGDLLAVWYSCNTEPGRELGIVASRLRRGAREWEPASPFWDTPDRNDHAPAMWFDGKDTLYHFNGLSAGPGYRTSLALVLRVSKDNGATWSRARLINPERGLASQPVTTVFRARDGRIVLPVDAPWLWEGGATALWMSGDEGKTWSITDAGATGIHAGFVQLADGRLLSFGRYRKFGAAHMPQSISSDMGKTWARSDSEFPPIGGGQRLVLMRLREGPILLVSFAGGKGMQFPSPGGGTFHGLGMFAALSFDEGKTWPVKKLITPGGPARKMDGLGNTHEFIMDDTHAEPKGYLAATQTPDRVIHLISSALHYRFNLAWINTPAPVSEARAGSPAAAPAPDAVDLPVKASLAAKPKGGK